MFYCVVGGMGERMNDRFLFSNHHSVPFLPGLSDSVLWLLRLYYDVLCRALRGLCFTTVLTIKQRNISRAVVVGGVRRRRRRRSQGHKKGVCCS